MKTNTQKALLIFLVIAAVFAASIIGAKLGAAGEAEPAADDTVLDAVANTSIPGYDVLKLAADQIEQQVYFYNPAQNQCFFVISIECEGRQLYQSAMLSPNTKVENISLSVPLPAGFYAGAVLRYSCFDLYTQREMNGAEMTIRLEVE